MKIGDRSHFSCVTPFRPVAESARMINTTSYIVLLLAIVIIGFMRADYTAITCVIPVAWALLLERSIVFCRGARQNGSTSHTVLLAVIAWLLLSSDADPYLQCLLVTIAVLLKHFQGGLGNYICHPVLAAIVIIEFIQPSVSLLSDLNISSTPMNTLDYTLFNTLDVAGGLTGIAGILADKIPAMQESLLGIIGGAYASCPVAFVLAGLYFIYRGYYNWRVPLLFLVAVAFAASALPVKIHGAYFSILNSSLAPDVIVTYILYQALTGYTVFIASVSWLDFTSRPLTLTGQLVMAFVAGTGLIALRLYTTLQYPEAASIVLAGVFVPCIDRMTRCKVANKMC